jgi:hypothetical protein
MLLGTGMADGERSINVSLSLKEKVLNVLLC